MYQSLKCKYFLSDSGQGEIKTRIEVRAFVQHYSEINREWQKTRHDKHVNLSK